MFIYEDGTITGSINWAELKRVVEAREGENVSSEGWSRLDALVKEHDGEAQRSADEAAERTRAAAEANEEAGAVSHEPVADDSADESDDDSGGPTKAELQEQLRERGLPTSGNKAELQARLNESEEV